jgi:magnesium transporter
VTIKIYASTKGSSTVEEHPPSEVAALLADPNVVFWVDLCGHNPEHDVLLGEVFKIHPLVLEDMFRDAPQPKVEDFDDYLYLVVHGLDRNAEQPDNLETIELDLVLGPRFIVTHHPITLRSTDILQSDIKRSAKLFAKGPAFVAHAILDHLSDHYNPLMEKFDEEIEALESRVLRGAEPHVVGEIFEVKRSVAKIRRIASHQRDVVQRLARGEFELIDEAALPFYRDIADNFVRVTDLADSYRELLSSVLDMYMSVQGQKLNEIMKVLTLMSTIMLPMTFVAGLYGMNFDFMPETHWKYGYLFAILLMSAIAIGLVTWFKRRRWI